MRKKGFKHECQMSFGNGGGKRKASKKTTRRLKGSDKDPVKEIYNQYYRNQVAALYNAVKGK